MKKIKHFKKIDAVIKSPVGRVPSSRERIHTPARTPALTTYKQGTRSRMGEIGDEEGFATCFGRTSRVR